MKLEDVLPAFRQGKKIKRASHDMVIDGVVNTSIGQAHLLADDWEIVENPSERKQELAKEILKLQDQMRPMLEEWSKIE